jgi:hypothetical protein
MTMKDGGMRKTEECIVEEYLFQMNHIWMLDELHCRDLSLHLAFGETKYILEFPTKR